MDTTGLRWVKASERLPEESGHYIRRFVNTGHLVKDVQHFNPSSKPLIRRWIKLGVEWLEELESSQPIQGAVTSPEERLKPPHKCIPIARAQMSEGRDWWVGKLTERVEEFPVETHCLHLKTPLKDVVFLCNSGDFQQLSVLCRHALGYAINEDWMQSQLEMTALESLPEVKASTTAQDKYEETRQHFRDAGLSEAEIMKMYPLKASTEQDTAGGQLPLPSLQSKIEDEIEEVTELRVVEKDEITRIHMGGELHALTRVRKWLSESVSSSTNPQREEEKDGLEVR